MYFTENETQKNHVNRRELEHSYRLPMRNIKFEVFSIIRKVQNVNMIIKHVDGKVKNEWTRTEQKAR